MTNSTAFRKGFFFQLTMASLGKTAVLYGGVEQKVSIFNNLEILVFDPPCVLNRNVTPVNIIWINRTDVLFRATPAYDQIQQSGCVFTVLVDFLIVESHSPLVSSLLSGLYEIRKTDWVG